MILFDLFLILLAIVCITILLTSGNDNDHPKYPPTDTLGGWD